MGRLSCPEWLEWEQGTETGLALPRLQPNYGEWASLYFSGFTRNAIYRTGFPHFKHYKWASSLFPGFDSLKAKVKEGRKQSKNH